MSSKQQPNSPRREADRRPRTLMPRLLVIEDDDMQRELMAMILETAGLECTTAGSLDQARRVLADGGREHFDLVVSDFDLGDGYASALLEQHLLAPERMILVSAHDRGYVPRDVAYFRKPIDLDAFLVAVRARLGALDRPADDRPVSGTFARPTTGEIELVLYIASNTACSTQAEQMLNEVLAELDTRRLELHVIDLARGPSPAAAEDRVVFTPTLVRRRPGPRVWLVGELNDRQRLLDLLQASGLQRRTNAARVHG